ncbi:sensor histidine kinase [Paractinoplanes rishiriensis]|uniref:histidine kinase n=1 Tax=Paractinoplanes rishiriensis TaxID=1050105 RepID=A0A919K6J1_9ACTN|nr:ATP-binding protein [Actinoplanes rishiriensis]GIE99835.1 hypothetical protein Ari01nite_73000 [Actinoplanes rishiriensis]
MPDTSSSYEQADQRFARSLPGQLTWSIAVPAAVAAGLFATAAWVLALDDVYPGLVVLSLAGIVTVLASALYAVGQIRHHRGQSFGFPSPAADTRPTGTRSIDTRPTDARSAGTRSELDTARSQLAEARASVDRLTEQLRQAEARPAPAAASSTAYTPGKQVEIFVNLSRRLQSLVHREIKLLDALENEVEDPDLLKGLFQVDHLATRIRRHAENLAVLGGSVSRRQWSRPVALTEVLRSATAEVEQYSRVKLVPPIEGTLPGHAVASIIHLIAELIENATMFAPPHTQVLLRAQQVAAGVAIEVEDRGLGMQRVDQERVNQLLANPEHFNLDDLLRDGRIGLFVVSMIARQHGIVVQLQTNIYGGTQAVVILPEALLGAEPAPAVTVSAVAAVASAPVSPGRPRTLDDHTAEMPRQPAWSNSSAARHLAPAEQPHQQPALQQAAHQQAAHQQAPHQLPAAAPAAARPPLPRRRSQTHMAPQLQLGPQPANEPTGDSTPGLMASFMSGVSQAEADPAGPDRLA